MDNLIAENERLKVELAKAAKIIVQQQVKIQRLEKDFQLELQEAIDFIVRDGSTILNPLPKSLDAAHNNKHEEFLLNPTVGSKCVRRQHNDGNMNNEFHAKSIKTKFENF